MPDLATDDPRGAGLLVGALWPATDHVPYPRADPADLRLPRDSWARAQVPAGVHLAWRGTLERVEITVTTTTDQLGPRGPGGGTTCTLWCGPQMVGEVAASLGTHRYTIVPAPAMPGVEPPGTWRLYLPEVMGPEVTSVRLWGDVDPIATADRHLVLAYGDSIVEGWQVSSPALAWPAVLGRSLDTHVANLGYAGACRGELASAEQIAALSQPVDAIVVAFGTNCWSLSPHSPAMVEATLDAFLRVLHQGHPTTPVAVVTPVVRPDAEAAANRLGATLADLRAAEAGVVASAASGAGTPLVLVDGMALLGPDQLVDGVHPGDDGHRAIAEGVGAALADMLGHSGRGWA